ncbi:hypothetical protein [Coleofasciculus sp. F4-SAH-05]|uniref:hypothetical protein n=1 Tax=Coleofasciculus sp. F4-SAH-05 TaxID=3069525 RepID=UPI003304FEA0
MSSSDSVIKDSDIFICEAFKQILNQPAVELEKTLGSQMPGDIRLYLRQLPSEDYQNPAAMANHITEFCQQPGNEALDEWLGEIYDGLDTDGIDKLVKKTGDPGEEADAPTETNRILINEARDICQYLQNWATQQLNQRNQGNNPPVQGQGKPGNQNAAN